MGRAWPRLLLAVWIVALATFAQAQETISPVDEIRIRGNERVETEAVRVHLRVTPGQPIDPGRLDEDLRRIYAMGFFSDVQARIDTEQDRRILVIQLDERPMVREVKIVGADEISEEDIEAALRIRPNTILDLEKVNQGIEEAEKLYDQKGYKDADIKMEVSERDENNTVELTFQVNEGEVVRVQEIVFEGNEAFSDRTLRGILQTKEAWFLSFLTGAGNLDPEVLKTDVERLTAYYYENGYVNVRIDEPGVKRVGDGLEITFKIDEGSQYQIGAVDVEGELIAEKETILERIETKAGETFRASRLREDIFTLTEIYGDQGYAFANVEPRTALHPEDKTVDITFQITKGPLVSFDRIEIVGNTKTMDEVIRRELAVREQQRFSGSRLKRSRERLERLGFFQEVNITTRRTQREDQLDLIIDVKEAQTGAFTAGAGFSSADRFIFNARLSEQNLFGSGDRVSLNVDIGSIRQNLTLDYIDPFFMDTYFTAAFSGFNWKLEFDDFDRSGTGASVQFLYPFSALGIQQFLGVPLIDTRFGLEYKFEQAEIGEISSFFRVPAIAAEEGEKVTSSVIPTVVRNTLNHPFDPTDGSVQNFSLEFAGIGGQSDFLKVEARSRWFVPFFKSDLLGTFVASAGGRVAWGQGQEGRSGKELPLFERFFPGGINSVRGFETRTLGPREPVFDPNGNIVDTTPIGGSSQLVLTSELIFPIVEPLGLRGVLFFDAGNAFRHDEGIPLSDLRLAAGWGVRWLSPIGPLRIEIGYPLDPREDEDSSVFLFSFGAPL